MVYDHSRNDLVGVDGNKFRPVEGRQIGRMLFGEALRAVKESHPGPCTLELNVNRSNRARGFYEKMGMRVVREGDFPIGEGYYMNDYIMGMEL